MLGLRPDVSRGLHLMCLGAHPDDIEIGAGGTILQLVDGDWLASATWIVFSGTPDRVAEGRTAADAFLRGVAVRTVTFHAFRDGYFPAAYGEVKDAFEALKAGSVRPDVILAPRSDDAHQDHRLIAELARTTFRDHLILEYEIPKYDGDLATPNTYIVLDQGVLERKVELLVASFPSQSGRTWFDPEVFRGLARIRGIEAGGDSRYAEGFHARNSRFVLGRADRGSRSGIRGGPER